MELSIDTIKSAALGGFEKESTLLYIRTLMETHEEECAKLRAEIEALRKINDAFTAQSKMDFEQVSKMITIVKEQSRSVSDVMTAENRSLREMLENWKTRESSLVQQEEQVRQQCERQREKTRQECERQCEQTRQECARRWERTKQECERQREQTKLECEQIRHELKGALRDILSAQEKELSALSEVSMQIEDLCLRYHILRGKAQAALAKTDPVEQTEKASEYV